MASPTRQSNQSESAIPGFDAPRRIGLYGGSFDPIHHAHLILAREAMERLGLAKVVFFPAAVSPHKMDSPPAPADLRLEMLHAALCGEPGFEVDDCELRREGVSYTVDTVRIAQVRFPGAALIYFIGDDNLPKLHTWHRIDELKQLVQFVVFARDALPEPPTHGFPVIDRRVDISSTDIRNRVARGQSIRYLLPERVCEIIARCRLYSNE